MKRDVTLLLRMFFALTCISKSVAAQRDTIFVNELGSKVEKDKAEFYRLIEEKNPNDIVVTEYYLSNKLHFIGHYSNREANIKQGEFVYYNPDGFKASEGRYTKGYKDGEWIYYYDEGRKVKEREQYSYPKKECYSIEYDMKTNMRYREGWMDQFGKRSGLWTTYFPDSISIKYKFMYQSGEKVGEQLEFYSNGQLKRREICNKFDVEKGELFDEKGKSMKYYPAFSYPKPPEYLTKYLDVRVTCFRDLIKKKNINYSIKIHKDGSVSDAEITNIPDCDCKQDIIQTLNKMRKWKPARSENNPVEFTNIGTLKYGVHNE